MQKTLHAEDVEVTGTIVNSLPLYRRYQVEIAKAY